MNNLICKEVHYQFAFKWSRTGCIGNRFFYNNNLVYYGYQIPPWYRVNALPRKEFWKVFIKSLIRYVPRHVTLKATMDCSNKSSISYLHKSLWLRYFYSGEQPRAVEGWKSAYRTAVNYYIYIYIYHYFLRKEIIYNCLEYVYQECILKATLQSSCTIHFDYYSSTHLTFITY